VAEVEAEEEIIVDVGVEEDEVVKEVLSEEF